ncbi:MAG: hypothetical protein ACLP4V_30215 [Methylocella sp.]
MRTKPKTPKAPARMASAPKPDPIFALIAEHQATIDHLDTVWKLTGGDDAPGYAAAEDIEGKTFKRLINTKPKTLAGLAAFADYAVSYFKRRVSWWPLGDDDGVALATIAKALRGMARAEKLSRPE